MSEWNEGFEREDDLLAQRRRRRMEMKRKRQKQQRIILAAAAAVLVLLIILLFRGCSNKKPKENDEEIILPPSEEEIVVAKPDLKATLAAVGDIMLYDTQLADAQQEDLSYDFTDCFLAVSAYTTNADLTVGNLETIMTGNAPYTGKPNWNAPESLAKNLQSIGFDVMLTANTVSITHGVNGLTSTAKFLNSVGIDNVGTHITDPDEEPGAGAIMRETPSGIKIAFIGFTKGLEGRSLVENSEYCVDLLYSDYRDTCSKIDSTSILDRIEDAKTLNPDVIVALCHWGSEYELGVSESQEDITELMLENGVDVILGSHSHVAGPMGFMDVTTTDGEEKTCFVAYSLGNFVSDMDKDYTMESLILNLEFTKSGETGKTTITNANYTPLYILDAGEDADCRFQVLPIRSAIQSKLFEDFEPMMTEAIANLEKNTKLSESSKSLDSGN